jgi:uncharacterized protein (DUF2236 family)
VSILIGDFGLLLTTGFLPPEFREKMGLDRDPRQQQLFDMEQPHCSFSRDAIAEPLRALPSTPTYGTSVRTGHKLI